MKPSVRSRWFNTATVKDPRVFDDQAKQEFRTECDVNVILARYEEPRPWRNAPVLQYGDFASAPDFLGAQLLVKAAEEQFNALPGRVRDRFNHSALEMLRFLGDKANLEEAVKLGLCNPPPPPAPTPEPPKAS